MAGFTGCRLWAVVTGRGLIPKHGIEICSHGRAGLLRRRLLLLLRGVVGVGVVVVVEVVAAIHRRAGALVIKHVLPRKAC